jgi:hypothetical protein
LSARRIDADLASKSSEILQQIASLELTFISGWHSQLEVDALRILLSRSARIISCLSKSLVRFTPSTEIKSLIGQSRILVLTHCSPKAKRISRDASL